MQTDVLLRCKRALAEPQQPQHAICIELACSAALRKARRAEALQESPRPLSPLRGGMAYN